MIDLILGDCPFCGQVEGMESTSIHIDSDPLEQKSKRYWWVNCDSCGARGPEEQNEEMAILGWNRIPAHWAGEKLAPCDKCAGSGRWYDENELKESNMTDTTECRHDCNSDENGRCPICGKTRNHQKHCRASLGAVCCCVNNKTITENFI